MRVRPSSYALGRGGTQAAEYPVDDVCQDHEALGLCFTGLPSGEAVDLSRLVNASHAGKPSVGAQVECALSQSMECQ